jgi:hypothetical protein
MFMQRSHSKILRTAFFGLAWLIAVGVGLRMLGSYEATPGVAAEAPSSWPQGADVPHSADRPTLVMLAHPHCPCTRASIAELAQIVADAQGKVAAFVLFLKPSSSGPDWDDTPLREAAAAIPGVTVVSDVDGAQARRFGAETSGHTVVFSPDGRLLFTGGITAARGHAGGNAGETAVRALLSQQLPARTSTPVFGCSFTTPAGS